jgi:fructokinase
MLTVLGEALIDLVPSGPPGSYEARAGGSPFNVAVGLARLRNHTALMARLSDHGFGRILRSAAAAEGIDLRAAPHATQPTTLAVVFLDEAARASYEFYLEGTADWQWTTAELGRLHSDAEVLHFGSLASWTAPGSERIAALVRDVHATGRVLVSYDPNVRPPVVGARARARELVERSARHAHVVKASREDIDWLYPGRAVDEISARWNALGAALVVVTDGPHGATAHRAGGEPLRRPGRAVSIVDTIGAGDAFTAGMLSGLVRRGLHVPARAADLSDAALADILDEAVLVSSVTCERAGADPPRLRTARVGGDLSLLTLADLVADPPARDAEVGASQRQRTPREDSR